MDDSAYKQYLQKQFIKIGNHTMSLEDLTVRTDKVGGKYSHQVVFEINTDEVRYFTEEDTAAARTAWAKAVMNAWVMVS